ncbi:MAG: Uma2 family endonuclease [Candidatus Competibacteraceae bacterium]|jgi:Uma2 family endonuclease|nr:Uma2 family endonuclease [Candidatus Competibacteraceae bacterium]
MQWQEVIDNPYLKDLPFKIELNRWGNIEMSPAINRHALIRSRLAQLIKTCIGEGETLTECSVQTSDGVRVPDVAWASWDYLKRHQWATPFPSAPEICVEIVSPSNNRDEMMTKVRLLLEAGAEEVWLVREDNGLEIYGTKGLMGDSEWIPDVAARVKEFG